MSEFVSSASGRRPRVLLLAYACSPYHGSERGIGWHRSLITSRIADTWTICEGRVSWPDVQRYLALHGPIPSLTFVPLPKTPFEATLTRVKGCYYAAYHLWHRRAFRLARQLHETIGFDLVHQINLCGFREPGYLWKLDAPFVWGPVGGTQNYPWRFLGEAGLAGAIAEAGRTVANALQLRLSPRVRRALRKASVLLVANSTNAHDFATACRADPVRLLETGLSWFPPPGPPRARSGSLRILWSGELRPFKALPLLLKALARLPRDLPCELRVLGKGPAEPRWRLQAEQLGVARQVTWMGRLPHAEALRQYDWADTFVFTSLRDTSGNAVLEALAAGVPVVCFDHQGVADIVTAESGVKIPVTTPEDAVTRLAAALERLARDRGHALALAEGARRRARDFDWSLQEARMAEIYRQVLGGRFVWDRPMVSGVEATGATLIGRPLAGVGTAGRA
jgi:glycosyltransferase involved in cell wall biosynthesis